MGSPAKVTFFYGNKEEAFTFTTDNSGYLDSVGAIIAKTIMQSEVTNFLRLATNVLAEVSNVLPKRTAVAPANPSEAYYRYVNFFYEVHATMNYEDTSKEVRDVVVIKVRNSSGETLFDGVSSELVEAHEPCTFTLYNDK